MRSESNFTAVVKPHRQFVKRQPFFSIIIPTYSRREQLSACLQSLTRLDYPRDRFEVIVVDDGSETPPIAPVALFQDRLNLTLLTQPHAGPATARNTGAAQAKGDFLVFTDDDCAPAPDWLQTLAARFASAPDHAIGGQTLNALHDNLYSTASQALINYLYAYYNAVPGKAVFFTSNNLALPAGRFRAIGGFDTRFLLAAGEDRELCDRWLNHGYPMTFAPEVVVYHAHALTLRSFGRQHFNYGRSAFHFHRVRARRREAGIKVEPLSFYLNMLRRSLVRGWRGLWPAVLLAVSQLANAAGFFYERFRSTNQQAEKASYSKQPAVITEKVFKWWDYPLFILLTGLSSASILYFMWYWFSFKDWLYYPVTFSILTFILIVKLSINQFRWFLLPCMRRPRPVAARSGWKVGVATTYVPGAEPLAMLAETVRALVALDYPHDTWVLDEGDDEQVKALCLRLGADYFSRGNLPHYQNETGLFQSHSKHGNYNAWLSEIGFDRYEIITAFDPDHVPDPTFLSNVLGYFEDPKIGYVQVAQVYYNQKASFIARGAAEETYAYYSATQMASYAMGYPIITGSHNTHRASALKQVGGFASHDADDLLIT
ncbi:MAG: glycosyltransferase family 2 protein, partial [Pyrinomonadaceae bacterium]